MVGRAPGHLFPSASQAVSADLNCGTRWAIKTFLENIGCNDLTKPSNGDVNLYEHNQIARYRCKSTLFRLMRGSERRKCIENKVWSGTEPECVAWSMS